MAAMKHVFKTLILAFGVGSLFVSHPLSAQDNRAVADVPFAFVVANRTLAAGKYDVSQLKNGTRVFSLRNENGDSLFVQLAGRMQGNPGKPSLTFFCHGKDCVLAKITPPNSGVAYGLTRGSLDVNRAKTTELASMVSITLKSH
jgi:hypothetical protein